MINRSPTSTQPSIPPG